MCNPDFLLALLMMSTPIGAGRHKICFKIGDFVLKFECVRKDGYAFEVEMHNNVGNTLLGCMYNQHVLGVCNAGQGMLVVVHMQRYVPHVHVDNARYVKAMIAAFSKINAKLQFDGVETIAYCKGFKLFDLPQKNVAVLDDSTIFIYDFCFRKMT